MSSNWAPNLFKGRIGEAVVEAILSEFGYKVHRGGFEQVSSGDSRVAPDLVVTDPRTQEERHVEVKYKAARPTAVQLDPTQIAAYKKLYPGTILAISSAWDGAIYCCQVEELPLKEGGGLSTLSLLGGYWKPIWHHFPLVKRGERLSETWRKFQAVMSTYGSRQVFGRPDHKLWDEEYDALARYLHETWDECLPELGIARPQVEKMTLEELWEAARHINAAVLAQRLLDPSEENPIESPLTSQAVDRVLGRRGEEHLWIDLEQLAKALGLDEEDAALQGIVSMIGATIRDPGGETAQLAKRLVEELEDGVGEVYLVDQAVPFQDSESIDLKTAIKLALSPCRIDR